jgi:hypothetical protein
MGRSLGQPGDSEGQRAVLRATLHTLESIQTPGGRVDLPFEWIDGGEKPALEPPPIARYISRHPWALLNLLNRKVPAAD